MSKKFDVGVGPCPYCKRTTHWYNDVPLKAFCWGTEKKPHREWHKMVPAPHNPYLKIFWKNYPRVIAEMHKRPLGKLTITRSVISTNRPQYFVQEQGVEGGKWFTAQSAAEAKSMYRDGAEGN